MCVSGWTLEQRHCTDRSSKVEDDAPSEICSGCRMQSSCGYTISSGRSQQKASRIFRRLFMRTEERPVSFQYNPSLARRYIAATHQDLVHGLIKSETIDLLQYKDLPVAVSIGRSRYIPEKTATRGRSVTTKEAFSSKRTDILVIIWSMRFVLKRQDGKGEAAKCLT